MALFYFTIGVSDNTFSLKEKLEKIRYEGANISYTIISSSHVILKINEVELNVQYELSKSSIARYFWYLCDAYNQESLIILCDSPNVNENGKTGTFGLSTYNRAYFRYKEKMIEVPLKEDTFSDRFNLIKGNFNTFDDETIGNNLVTSKCTFNSGNNIDNGEIISIDNLYVSAGLQDIDFRTIIKDSKGNTFINIGGIFYANNVDYVVADSTCPNLILVPDGRIKYQWNANTELVPNGLYDSNRKILAIFHSFNYGVKKENNQILFDGNWSFPIPQDEDNGFTLYAVVSARNTYHNSRYSSFPRIDFLDQDKRPVINKELSNGKPSGIFANTDFNEKTLLGLETRIPRSSEYPYPKMYPIASSNTTYWISDYDISDFPILLYTFKFEKHKKIDYNEDINFSLFINDNLIWEGQLAAACNVNVDEAKFPITISSFYISDYNNLINHHHNKRGILKYVGIQPGKTSNEEILDNLNYLTKKFKLDKEV